MIEISEKHQNGLQMITREGASLGVIGKLENGKWIAIPEVTGAGNVDLSFLVCKLRRDALTHLDW